MNLKTDESVPGFMDGNDMIPMLKHGVTPTCNSRTIHHRNNPPIYWWDWDGPGTLHTQFIGVIKTPDRSCKTDKSVRMGDVLDVAIPTINRGVTPIHICQPQWYRNNPPIYWWDTEAPTLPPINRFNGFKDKG